MELLYNLFYFVITIGILVFVHEFGHFLAAKLCGMRVDRFSIGFPPRAFGKKYGDTDYCVSWIPVGGYVKIAGMIDESMDTEYLNAEPQPWEFRSKPVWQRMIVISAGVTMNILLAILIFWGINYSQGESYRQTTEIGYVVPESPAAKTGLQVGDRIISINGSSVRHWDEIQNDIYLEFGSSDLSFTVERSGHRQTIPVRRSLIPDISETTFGLLPAQTEAVITEVASGKPAAKAGLAPDDVILSLNGEKVTNQFQVIKIIKSHPSVPISIDWKRGGRVEHGIVTPTADGLIGIGIEGRYTGPVLNERYGVLESFPKGIENVYSATSLFVHSIWQIAAGKASFTKSVGGPIKIAQFATRSAEVGLASFLAFVALLSISLAVMNILPFPALDGGHLIILAYEAIVGKPLPQRVQQGVQQAGMVLLLTFMAFVIYNDIAGF